jgi:hypothetical protein
VAAVASSCQARQAVVGRRVLLGFDVAFLETKPPRQRLVGSGFDPQCWCVVEALNTIAAGSVRQSLVMVTLAAWA